MSLSERIRSGCEAAPWVCDEVQNLEATNRELCEEVQKLKAINAELLEAAIGVVQWWDSDAGVSPSVYGLIDRLWAAIAKAKGEGQHHA